MPSCSITFRPVALLLLALPMAALGQASGESPYSAYGIGDLQPQAMLPQHLMGGTGVAVTEPIGLVLGNPASYVGLFRPSFEAGVALRSTSFSSAKGDAKRNEAGLSGFGVGVPFGKGKWGLALGLTTLSDVSYSILNSASTSVGTVDYTYTGTGGIDRVFAGVGRVLYSGRPVEKGGRASRLSFGANFDFLFGSLEQTRVAAYPLGAGFSNTRAFSSLVLRAPTFDVGLQFSSQLVPKERVAMAVERRKKRYEERVEAWRKEHPGMDVPFSAPQATQAIPWRYTIGLTATPAARMNATYNEFISSFTSNSSGTETFRDTISYLPGTRGTLELPLDIGFGVSVHNARWMVTAEMHHRDWSALKVDVDGYRLPTGLRSTTTYAVGARYQPSFDGGLFHRAIYRAGLRYAEDYRDVPGGTLDVTAFTAGLSLPINAAQTNSFLHLGVELGQRGTTDAGLIQERYVMFRIGLSITPWKGERWFVPYRIQ